MKELVFSVRETGTEIESHNATTAQDLYDNVLKERFSETQESFYIIPATNKFETIGILELFKGGSDACNVFTDVVFRVLLSTPLCTNFFVAHNHPAGSLEPSTQDKKITKKLEDAGELLGVKLIDHIIFSGEDFYSFNAHRSSSRRVR